MWVSILGMVNDGRLKPYICLVIVAFLTKHQNDWNRRILDRGREVFDNTCNKLMLDGNFEHNIIQ